MSQIPKFESEGSSRCARLPKTPSYRPNRNQRAAKSSVTNRRIPEVGNQLDSAASSVCTASVKNSSDILSFDQTDERAQ